MSKNTLAQEIFDKNRTSLEKNLIELLGDKKVSSLSDENIAHLALNTTEFHIYKINSNRVVTVDSDYFAKFYVSITNNEYNLIKINSDFFILTDSALDLLSKEKSQIIKKRLENFLESRNLPILG